MLNFWNTIKPVSVNLQGSNKTAYALPPLNNPLPNHILPPGSTPLLPTPAVPASPGDLKRAINSLPSIFKLIK